MYNEWNSRVSVSELCNTWKKIPKNIKKNLSILLYNVESLNTYITDVDILIASYNPLICILTGVGSAVKRNITFPNYPTISQPGTNAFGGVMVLGQKSIKYKIIETDINYILIEVELTSNAIIDFGITQDASGWISQVLDEGTSDHFPLLIQSPLAMDVTSTFKKTNWKLFNFFSLDNK
ncbi:unnamed protein product [Rotaria socialis]